MRVHPELSSVQLLSHVRLCNPMNCSTPGFSVHHQHPEFIQTHVPSSRWCRPAISSSVVPFSYCPQSLPASESFPMSQLSSWGGQSIGVSASASVLPMNTQDWFPLEGTGWISLQSKGLSRVFSNTIVDIKFGQIQTWHIFVFFFFLNWGKVHPQALVSQTCVFESLVYEVKLTERLETVRMGMKQETFSKVLFAEI